VAAAHARIVVPEVKLAHQDQQETTAVQETAELQEAQETPVTHRLQSANKQLHLHAIHALLDHPDHLDHQEPQEMLDQMDNPDKAVPTLNPDLPDQKAHPDQLEIQETQDLMDNQEHPLNLKKPEQDNLVQLEMPVHQDHQDQQVNQDNLAAQEPPDQKDLTVTPAVPETMDNPEPLDNLDSLEVPEKRVFARNTVLSTEVSSSKTELADVKLALKRRKSVDLPTSTCPMNTDFLLVAQKTAIYYVSLFLVFCPFRWTSHRIE